MGSQAPQLRLERLLQAPVGVNLNQALKGRVVVLEFWATWCAPCAAAVPHLNQLAEHFANDNVVFLAITDESEERVKRYLQKRPLAWWIGLDRDRTVFDQFKIRFLPTTVLISSSGEIVLVTARPVGLTEDAISQLLRSKRSVAAARKRVLPVPPESSKQPAGPILEITIVPTEDREPVYSFNKKTGILVADAIPVRTLFGLAYDVSPVRVLGSSHILNQWVRIHLRLPPRAAGDLLDTLRGALSTAFAADVRREVREIPAYVLRISASGARGLRRSTGKEAGHLSTDAGLILASSFDIGALSSELEAILAVPVVDQTDLSGKYDWDLSFDPAKPQSVVDAAREQLGLELVRSTIRAEVLVVEQRRQP